MECTYALKNREEVRTALQAANKEVHLFCGHYHTTNERSDGCIHQYITPSIFYQIKKYSETLERDDKPFGYRIIELDRQVSSQIITFGT
jgi:Icc protein